MGCMSASGGALLMKYGDNIVITLLSLQKEKVTEDDLFMLNQDSKVLVSPSKSLKLSSCPPNFMNLYEIRGKFVTRSCQFQDFSKHSHPTKKLGLHSICIVRMLY